MVSPWQQAVLEAGNQSDRDNHSHKKGEENDGCENIPYWPETHRNAEIETK